MAIVAIYQCQYALIASLGLHGAFVLSQDVHRYPPYKEWRSYRVTPLGMLAIGYAF